MRGELRRADVEALRTLVLERGCDLAMELDAREPPDALVEHLTVQRVPEHVPRFGRRAVGGECKVLQPALAAGDLCARVGQRHLLGVEGVRHGREPELHAAHARCLQKRALLRRQFLDVALDHARERVGHRHGGQSFVRIGLRCRSREKVVDDAGDEQRQAVRAVVQRPHERRIGGQRRHARRHVLADFRLGEVVERELCAEAMQAQLLPHRRERVVGRDQLRHAETAEPEQPCRRAAAREVVDELHRGLVAPVQVLGDQQERSLLRVAIEELAHLAQHPGLAGTGQLAPQRLALFRRREPGQLEEPCRRDRADQVDERGIATRQVGERLEDRQMRLAGAVLLHAMPVRTVAFADLAHEPFEDGALADAGLARHPHDLAPARVGGAPCGLEPREHVGTADRRRRGHRLGFACRRRCREDS